MGWSGCLKSSQISSPSKSLSELSPRLTPILIVSSSNIPAEKYDHIMFRRLIDINLTGSFLMSQAVGKAMMAAGKPGSIVLVASMSGSIVNYPQEQSCYNASKAGVIQFGKSLGAEWAKYNIRVNCISPGKS